MVNDNISIVLTLRNRANLFKYNLDGLVKQDYDLSKVEVCVLDGGSTDSLYSILDRYSDTLTFRLAYADRAKSYIPVTSNFPGNEINLGVKYVASYDKIIKIDPEIVIKDNWLLAEVNELLSKDDSRMYNARCHFTEGDGWYSSFEDIVTSHEKQYHYAENGPFTRSRYYFCSGFSKARFLEMRGIEEMFGWGVGYDDDSFRSTWFNRYGDYEYEITAQAVHLWHGANKSRPTKEIANGRMYRHLKKQELNNVVRLKNGELVRDESTPWANPEMLSKIYTIHEGAVTNVEDVNNGKSLELDLPF
jgi:glycosyltransferase involved in cell wall biosynthesis